MSNEQQYLPTSIELWAASKIIGRECASTSLKYMECKKADRRADPSACLEAGAENYKCASSVVVMAKKKFPLEFDAFGKCLDSNGYRFGECREQESKFLDCWNSYRSYQ